MEDPKYLIGDFVIALAPCSGINEMQMVVKSCHFVPSMRIKGKGEWVYNGNIGESEIIRRIKEKKDGDTE